jgi:hypothetical protein
MFFVDMYWLIMPVVPEHAITTAKTYNELASNVTSAEIGYGFSPLNFTCLIGMLALVLGGTLINLRKCNLVATEDPRLNEALHFENA